MGFMIFSPIILAIFVGIIMLLVFIAAAIGLGIGGVSMSILVKNKTIKPLLRIGSAIAILVGLMFLCPFIVAKAELPGSFISWSMSLLCVIIGILSVVGVKFSKVIQNKIVRIVLTVLFYLLLLVAISYIILIIIVSAIFAK
ncbi:MAG: hypothetical protein LBU86_06010 [Oscillospiraceae bacterium]|jgi:hypothetical protein|nr:hypothetical protein [Oscillospiraceae bacterium]